MLDDGYTPFKGIFTQLKEIFIAVGKTEKMSTATAVRQGKTSTWSSMFPNEQITEQQSTLFVKKLLAVAVSNITYLRAMFPEQAFGDRSLEELNLKILRDDSSCPGACQVIKWMKGCFDALDKKYLERLIIGIYTNPNDLNSIIESYTFKFSYTQNGIDIYRNGNKITGAETATETRKATIQLLRTIIVLNQTLKPLPDDVWLTVKLYYHDEVTPPDYEPPGFKAADSDTSKTILDKTSKKLTGDKDVVCCPCGCNEDDGLMILCANCNYWQHAVCFCLLDETSAPSTHYCASCSKLVDKPCTDPSLVKMSLSDQQSLCLWRRVLLVCLEENKFTIQGLATKLGVENTVAHGFFNRLKMEGFINASSGKLKRNSKIVNVEKLRAVGIPLYFKKVNSEITKQNTPCEKMEICSVDVESDQGQVSQLAKQTNSLTLSNRKCLKSEIPNNRTNVISLQANSCRTSRGRKRAIIPTSTSCEDFEISCSQEEEVSKKRKKISLALKSILV
ncbi:HORMA domain-containing protein 1,HORMA domain-containing protein 2 [Acanthosepion pharaonis]|uniref:HORMA domain-containing protein 1,HORMA domain-containing protein 2 n=1 Tax=Acanthosepion pharaonis TaxID=158019 RepID=A0A812BIV4_ACAPH|nr:HORMA domain-containing protein 1,HORMA domain-containing protein 2 [Sepia pharaonis]